METTLAAESTHTITANDVILVAVAHPDDETVMHGEIIRRSVEAGAEVHIALATLGEASTVNHRVWNRNFVANKQRWHEALNACRQLGVPTTNLHSFNLADGKLPQQVPQITELLGELIATHHVTKIITSGPVGYDKHADHIAVDTAAERFVQQARNTSVQLWRLDKNGHGQIAFATDTPHKIRATIAHFSQFMGFHLFGLVYLPASTRRYMSFYDDLVHGQETYNVYAPDEVDYPDTYRHP